MIFAIGCFIVVLSGCGERPRTSYGDEVYRRLRQDTWSAYRQATAETPPQNPPLEPPRALSPLYGGIDSTLTLFFDTAAPPAGPYQRLSVVYLRGMQAHVRFVLRDYRGAQEAYVGLEAYLSEADSALRADVRSSQAWAAVGVGDAQRADRLFEEAAALAAGLPGPDGDSLRALIATRRAMAVEWVWEDRVRAQGGRPPGVVVSILTLAVLALLRWGLRRSVRQWKREKVAA